MTLLPHGPAGPCRLDWRDEFTADAPDPDPAKWKMATWPVNGVTPTKGNMWVYGGRLVLQLSTAAYGAAIVATRLLHVGEIVEARVRFPGTDLAAGDDVYNFPAFWTAGLDYPEDGEIDVAEGLGRLAVTYWTRAKEQGFKVVPPGDWNNAFHRYTLERLRGRARVWWDDGLVGDFETDDGGGPQRIILNVGYNAKRHLVVGHQSRVKVDYVRVWTR